MKLFFRLFLMIYVLDYWIETSNDDYKTMTNLFNTTDK